MIKFLYGDSGSGKSTYIIDEIMKDCRNGKSAILIVPEQQGVIAEESLAKYRYVDEPNRDTTFAQLHYEVLNFTRLANRVFRDYGGLKYNYVTKSAKNLIMYRAICECRGMLSDCKIEPGHEKSYVGVFTQAIAELKAYATSFQDFENLIEKLATDDDKAGKQLRNKLNNIYVIWSAYERILNESYTSDEADEGTSLKRLNDPLDDAMHLYNTLKGLRLNGKSFFKGKNVYIDSFYSFTKSQLNIIEEIVLGADNVTISFDCPINTPQGATQYAKITDSHEKIKSICGRAGVPEVKVFDKDLTHKESPDLLHLYKNIWNLDASLPKIKHNGSVTLARLGDEFEECEFIASQIREKIESGCHFSDIAIIGRNVSSYRGILDFTLEKYNITHFFSAPTDLISKPVIKMIFSALSAITSYKQDDIMSYIKCGYVGLEPDIEAELEAYVYRWGLQGKKCWDADTRDDYWCANPDGYEMEFSKEQTERLGKIIEARNTITNKLSPLKKVFEKKSNIRECAEAIFEFLNAHDIYNKLEDEKSKSKRQDALEIVQVWKSLLSALDTLVDVCGKAIVNPLTFATLLQYAFIDADIGTIPTAVDTVLIADASTVRTSPRRHVFMLGVNESVFPANVTDNSFFNDNEKEVLESHDIFLAEKLDTRVDDEFMFFRQGIAIAKETLTVSCISVSISGDKRSPSIGYSRIGELFEGIKEFTSSDFDILSKIYTRQNARELVGQTKGELQTAICNDLNIKERVTGFSNRTLSVSEKATKKLLKKGKLMLTQTAIEKFQGCHLSYYCDKVLRIRSNKKFLFGSSQVGDMFHSIFEDVLTKLKDIGKKKVADMATDEIDALVQDFTNDYISKICSGTKMTQRLNHLFERMRANLLVVVNHLVEEFLHSDFEAKYFELSFDGNGNDSPLPIKNLTLSDGTPIILHGIADRVDIYRNNDTTYVRIIDYKTGKKEFEMSKFEDGTQLQLFIYLFALWKLEDCNFKKALLEKTDKISPAGAYYLPLSVGKVTKKKDLPSNSDDEEKFDFISEVMPSGLILNNSEIRLAQDSSPEKKFSPVGDKSYISEDDFEQMFNNMKDIVLSIGTTMMSGDASVCEKGGAFSACEYCEMKPFCRRGTK